MNTPAHLVLNLCVLRGKQRAERWAVVVGAILPDAPMFLFYAWQKLWHKAPEDLIWNELYFAPRWQAFFDTFNAIPLIVLVGLSGVMARSRVAVFLAASMMLHVLGDLPLHHDDAHGHFFPLSRWRFESPVSYWDPQHYGLWFAPLELIASLACLVILYRRYASRTGRYGVIALGLGYLAYGLFAVVMWVA